MRDDFAQHAARDVADAVVDYYYDSIPLLTLKAYRYFLRYVQFACEHPDSNVILALQPHAGHHGGRFLGGAVR